MNSCDGEALKQHYCHALQIELFFFDSHSLDSVIHPNAEPCFTS
jgi:hypothetical protein